MIHPSASGAFAFALGQSMSTMRIPTGDNGLWRQEPGVVGVESFNTDIESFVFGVAHQYVVAAFANGPSYAVRNVSKQVSRVVFCENSYFETSFSMIGVLLDQNNNTLKTFNHTLSSVRTDILTVQDILDSADFTLEEDCPDPR